MAAAVRPIINPPPTKRRPAVAHEAPIAGTRRALTQAPARIRSTRVLCTARGIAGRIPAAGGMLDRVSGYHGPARRRAESRRCRPARRPPPRSGHVAVQLPELSAGSHGLPPPNVPAYTPPIGYIQPSSSSGTAPTAEPGYSPGPLPGTLVPRSAGHHKRPAALLGQPGDVSFDDLRPSSALY